MEKDIASAAGEEGTEKQYFDPTTGEPISKNAFKKLQKGGGAVKKEKKESLPAPPKSESSEKKKEKKAAKGR